MKTNLTVGILVTSLLAAPLSILAADKKVEQKVKPYPLSTCVVSGEKFGGDMGEPYVFAYEGREIKLCCKDCKKDFDKTPAKFVSKIDEAAKKVKPYPLTSCIVADEKLGEMGDPYVFIHEGQEVKLCGKSCKKDFDKAPAKFLKKVAKTDKKSR